MMDLPHLTRFDLGTHVGWASNEAGWHYGSLMARPLDGGEVRCRARKIAERARDAGGI